MDDIIGRWVLERLKNSLCLVTSLQGRSVEIYYLEDGKYILRQSYMLQDDKEEDHYNADIEIRLRAFLHIKMRLEEIFEGMD